MNYLEIYIKLVDSRLFRGIEKEPGYEIHHIIPKCLDGENENFNLVKLSYREHLVAHKLLAKIFFDNNNKLQYAVNAMLRNFPDREKHRQHMKKYNPMFEESAKKKLSATRKAKFASGELLPRVITDKERKMLSERMKINNPMTREPWKNHTASPVRVYWKDGTTEEFSHMKQITELKGIPYATLKYASRRSKGSPKWGITKMEKL
jgi:hypothetical protein